MEEENKKDDPFNDPEEQAHFKQVIAAFFNYSVIKHCHSQQLEWFIDWCDKRHCEDGEGLYEDWPQIPVDAIIRLQEGQDNTPKESCYH